MGKLRYSRPQLTKWCRRRGRACAAQPSSAAGSGTVPVRVSATGGGSRHKPQAGTPALRRLVMNPQLITILAAVFLVLVVIVSMVIALRRYVKVGPNQVLASGRVMEICVLEKAR